jgi:iron complex transport system substrate-binding protein
VFRRFVPLFAVALVAVACSSGGGGSIGAPSSPEASGIAADSFPVTVETDAGSVTLQKQPTAIVSLSPTATEMLFAIGAGPQVEAVDDQSNYPAEAPMTKLSGFTPNVEAITAYSPDLVVVSSDPGGLVRSLSQLDIPVLVQPPAATLDDSYSQISQLGQATGHPNEAAALDGQMRSKIEQIVASTPKPAVALSLYHELDDTYYSATTKTFIGQIYAMFGLTNIADEAEKASSGYPQLSAEYIISSDPDLILLADVECCKQSADTVGSRPGWGGIAAVKNGNVIALNGDVASRWGPRVVDFVQTIADAVTAEQGASMESPAA